FPAVLVFHQGSGTNGRVRLPGSVLPHRSGTNGGIVRSGRVCPERCRPNSAVSVAGVHKERSKTNGHVEVAVAVGERLCPNGHVLKASGVVLKRPRTNHHVITATGIVSKRTGTDGGIVDPSGDRVQRARSQCCISTCATSAWALCFERRRKRKPAKRNCQCKITATQWRVVNGTYQIFHFFCFFGWNLPC